jgi:hypothetical protein
VCIENENSCRLSTIIKNRNVRKQEDHRLKSSFIVPINKGSVTGK